MSYGKIVSHSRHRMFVGLSSAQLRWHQELLGVVAKASARNAALIKAHRARMRFSTPITVQDVIDAAALLSGLKPTKLLSRDRSEGVAEWRMAAMAAARNLARSEFGTPSYPFIGNAFNRDHTTVLYAVQTATPGRTFTNPRVMRRVRALERHFTFTSEDLCLAS